METERKTVAVVCGTYMEWKRFVKGRIEKIPGTSHKLTQDRLFIMKIDFVRIINVEELLDFPFNGIVLLGTVKERQDYPILKKILQFKKKQEEASGK